MTDKDNKILEYVSDLFDVELDAHRAVLERTWFRNILYYLGEQWLQWYAAQNTFGRMYELNVNMPTPVSNIIRDFVRSKKALTLNKTYTTTIWPNSEEQADKDAAEMGVSILEYLDNLNDRSIEDTKEMVELWRNLTGNAFARVMVNNDSGLYITDDDGNLLPTRSEVDVVCEVPFNVVVPDIGRTLREKPCIGVKNLALREWVEDTYKVKLSHDSGSNREVDYQKQLMTLVANVSPWKGRGLDSSLDTLRHADKMVVLKDVQVRPTPKYPRGRHHIVVDGQVIYTKDDMPIPVDRSTGTWHYDITHFVMDTSPGSFWGTSGVDDLISPQNTINRIDQALETNRDSLGRPFIMTPTDVVLKRISSRNQGILAIQYSGREAMGARPVIQSGTPYPQQVLEERRIHMEVSQVAAGDPKNVLRGQAPTSHASGVMVDILRETAEQSHAPDIRRFYRAWNRVQRKRLILAQHHYTESRLLKIKGEGNIILVKKFKGADIHGNTDVRLELDSGISTTNVGKNHFLMELINAHFWGPVSEQPQVQRELLKRMGLGGFPEITNLHRDRAEFENSQIAASEFKNVAFPGVPRVLEDGTPVFGADGEVEWQVKPTLDPVFRVDDHLVHMQVHDQYILSREFHTMPDRTKLYALAHRSMHKEAWGIEQQERLVMEQQAAMEGNPAESAAPATQPGAGALAA